jgi:3-phosphoshikimate 1-carboxyvinyltransferase
MRSLLVKQATALKGEVSLLGDKSIAHRSIIISAITPGKTTVENFPTNKDCLYTVKAFKKLGIKITQVHPKTTARNSKITVFGKGLYGFKKPKGPIFVGDSGTTLRLLLGVLAGQDFEVKLVAGKSLSKRPMLRVTKPLRMMGAIIKSKVKSQKSKMEEYTPITIKGGRLRPITYRMPVVSSQVKSAILLAGLYPEGKTQVIEPIRTRDHTERMFKLFKAEAKVKQNMIVIKGNQELVSPKRFYIPGDISSASFFIALSAILPNSKITIRNVSLNPLRLGIIRVLKRMGANIRTKNQEPRSAYRQAGTTNHEPMGDIIVKSSKLKGTIVKKPEVPSLIDELPILMVAAALAYGKTVIEGVGELRLKETDRIRSMSENLRKLGADINVLGAGKSENIIIRGVKELKGCRVRSFGDHRTAMSMVVAGMVAVGKTSIDDITCINKSFPEFLDLLKTIIP